MEIVKPLDPDYVVTTPVSEKEKARQKYVREFNKWRQLLPASCLRCHYFDRCTPTYNCIKNPYYGKEQDK